MMKTISAKEIRDRLGEYLDRAHLSGEVFVVTRKGRGKAVLLGAAEYLELIERLEALKNGKEEPPSPAPKRNEQAISKEELKTLIL